EFTNLMGDWRQAVADHQGAVSRGDIEAADALKAHSAALLECARSTSIETRKFLTAIEAVKDSGVLSHMASAEEAVRPTREEIGQLQVKLRSLEQEERVLSGACAGRVAHLNERQVERNGWLTRAQGDHTNVSRKILEAK